jgi:hypothetical protein
MTAETELCEVDQHWYEEMMDRLMAAENQARERYNQDHTRIKALQEMVVLHATGGLTDEKWDAITRRVTLAKGQSHEPSLRSS